MAEIRFYETIYGLPDCWDRSPSYSKSSSLLYIVQLEFVFTYSSYSIYYLLTFMFTCI